MCVEFKVELHPCVSQGGFTIQRPRPLGSEVKALDTAALPLPEDNLHFRQWKIGKRESQLCYDSDFGQVTEPL